MLRVVFGDHGLTGRAKEEWLFERLALYAGMEHFTAIVGQWFLDSEGLEQSGIHPMMLDLLRWHGAEEVEHRNVLFDVFEHVDGGYLRRLRTVLLGSIGLLGTFLLVLDRPLPAGPDPALVETVAGATRRCHAKGPGPRLEVLRDRGPALPEAQLPPLVHGPAG
ncbi:metal-dependent hydrolase [Nocardia arthritidis]|uniref:Metal-dependent hydrolase n=1 Tax=Nocardia arthritidis TaxID=228602 RepID=A0A6G9YL73_9NOCA|nr:metal-dependent hydrolase [Nocardia arthritidis]QIS13931.1 hypothetical protein F5544_30440 [Nocardia arthritidis]